MTADKIRSLKPAAYLLAILAGLWLPASKIISHVFPARQPATYRFAASNLYNDGDLFRGRYVKLRLEPIAFQLSAGQTLPAGRVYAALSRKANGFASIADVSDKPFKHRDCIRVEIDHTETSQGKFVCYLTPPVGSCYLQNLTPQSKASLRRLFDTAGRKWTAVVKVYPDGSCEVSGLEANDKDIIKELQRQSPAAR